MNSSRLLRRYFLLGVLPLTTLSMTSRSLLADSVLPTSAFFCEAADPTETVTCTGSAIQLPSNGGIDGTEINFSASVLSPGDSVTILGDGSANVHGQIQLEILGPLTGDDLPVGTQIPYTFSFQATSMDSGGTLILQNSFADVAGALPQALAITSPENCGAGPIARTNTCESLSETGSGLYNPGAVSSGTVLGLPFFVVVDTLDLPGAPAPTITISGTVDFNPSPVPEPRYSALAALSLLVLFLGLRRRLTSTKP